MGGFVLHLPRRAMICLPDQETGGHSDEFVSGNEEKLVSAEELLGVLFAKLPGPPCTGLETSRKREMCLISKLAGWCFLNRPKSKCESFWMNG